MYAPSQGQGSFIYSPQHIGVVPRMSLSPPQDPNSNYYLIVCYVCQEVAKPDQEHSLHYGGIVCYSCRAFFRRANQKTKIPDFQCKQNGTCVVTVANRRRCQKCRYERCLAANMSPDAVLTEDQKVVRFRKVLQKRQRQLEASENSSENDQPNDDVNNEEPQPQTSNSEDQEEEYQTLPKLIKIEEEWQESSSQDYDDDFKQDIEPQINIEESMKVENETDVYENIDMNHAENAEHVEHTEYVESHLRNVKQKTDAILHTYHMAAFQMATPFSNQFFKKMMALQSGETSITLEKREFVNHIIQLSEMFRHFALLQKQFGRLCKSDQRLLLARNTPLYVQLCLLSYLGAKNCSHQIENFSFLRNYFSQSENAEMDRNARFVTLNRFNEVTRLFKPGANLEQYNQYLQQFRSYGCSISKQFRPVLAYALIFDSDSSLSLTDVDEVRKISQDAEALARANSCEGLADSFLTDLKSLLKKMALFSSLNINWETNEETESTENQIVQLSSIQMTMVYTGEEEYWLRNQYQKIDEAFRSVTIGDDILREFFMYSLGVPLSKDYMKGVISITLERMWRVFNIHPEFDELPSSAQLDLMGSNGPVGLAVMISRYESRPFGIQQIQEGFGEHDEMRWRENYLPIFSNTDKVRRLRMRDCVADKSVQMTREQVNEYDRIVSVVTPLVSDPVMYKLLMLMALLKSTSSGKKSSLHNLQSTYIMVAKRRCEWMKNNKKKIRGQLEPQDLEAYLYLCLNYLEKLSKILVQVLNTE